MRSLKSRARLLAATVLPVLAAGCGDTGEGSPGTSGASCVGPFLNDLPPGDGFRGPRPTVDPGESLTIYGHWYTSTCNGTGGDDPLVPLPPVRLTLGLPGGAVRDLGEFAPAGEDFGFSTTVRVPDGATAGVATVRDDRTYPAVYRFEVGQARR